MITILLTILLSINLIFLSYGRLRVYYAFTLSYIKNFDKINNKTKQTSINILGGEVQKQ